MNENSPSIHLVDDDISVADACQFLLEGYGYRVTYWSDPLRFLAEADLHVVGCVILDLRMPGLEGGQVHDILRERDSSLAVVMLTAHGDVPMAVAEMKHGAVDFLQKPVDGNRLVASVQAALERSRELINRLDLMRRIETLSPREREVVGLVCEGLTNREVAERLSVAQRTVEVHRAAAMRKLGVERSADLIKVWEQLRNA